MRRRRSAGQGPSAAAIACHLALGFYPWWAFAAPAEPAGVPAVIVHPNAESRSELSRVIRSAFGGAPVTLADDALTASNMLSVGHANPRDPAGQPLNGRELSRPEVFELFKRGSRCVLVRTKNGHAWKLRHTQCVVMPNSALRAD